MKEYLSNQIRKDFDEASEINREIDKEAKSLKNKGVKFNRDEIADEIILNKEYGSNISTEEVQRQIMENERRAFVKKKFYSDEWYERTLYKSEDYRDLLDAMRTDTSLFREAHSFNKMLVALRIAEEVENSPIKNLDLYYLGASDDFRFPMALRFRNIVMVDPCYEFGFIKKISEELSKYEGFEIVEEDDDFWKVKFKFDFGKGEKEWVTIKFIKNDSYNFEGPSNEIGGCIAFFGGPSPLAFDEKYYSKIAKGGIIFDTIDIIKNKALRTIDEKENENITINENGFFKSENEIDSKKRERIIREEENKIKEQLKIKIIKIPGTSYQVLFKKENCDNWKELME